MLQNVTHTDFYKSQFLKKFRISKNRFPPRKSTDLSLFFHQGYIFWVHQKFSLNFEFWFHLRYMVWVNPFDNYQRDWLRPCISDGIKIQNSEKIFDELRKCNPDGKIMTNPWIFGAEICFSKFGIFWEIVIYKNQYVLHFATYLHN